MPDTIRRPRTSMDWLMHYADALDDPNWNQVVDDFHELHPSGTQPTNGTSWKLWREHVQRQGSLPPGPCS